MLVFRAVCLILYIPVNDFFNYVGMRLYRVEPVLSKNKFSFCSQHKMLVFRAVCLILYIPVNDFFNYVGMHLYRVEPVLSKN